MIHRHFLLVCATVGVFAVLSQSSGPARVPATRFTCQGRPSGYYADIDTGCQVYHMCDGLGRQFSYSCPNTTLFQQRMLICDHWYMVNCTNSESDYSANLLIGQRDKPFVSEADMRLRTPRPDILSVPLNNNYYDGLKEAESKYPVHPENSIVGIGDTISTANNNGLDGGKQNYRPPSSWSTGTSVNRPTNVRPRPNHNLDEEDNLKGSASQEPEPTYQPTPPTTSFTKNAAAPNVTPPSQHLVPPFQPITTTEEPHSSDEFQIDARMKPANEDRVFNFIKRFDPNSPDSIKTSMTKEEIEKINQELPAGQSSAEEDRTPRKNKNTGNNFNFVRNDRNKEDKNKFSFEKGPSTEPITASDINTNVLPEPSRELLPPKRDFSNLNPTTMGPPIYYEWKWAVPAFGLEPPKLDNSTNATAITKTRQVTGRNPFDSVTRPTSTTVDVTPSNTEYNISSYFVPDYIFPLDKPHPGYENENAETSFQVKVGRESRANYGENPACPQCHPAYLQPGTCKPCIVNR